MDDELPEASFSDINIASVIGEGHFGLAMQASWREQDVVLKVCRLPSPGGAAVLYGRCQQCLYPRSPCFVVAVCKTLEEHEQWNKVLLPTLEGERKRERRREREGAVFTLRWHVYRVA